MYFERLVRFLAVGLVAAVLGVSSASAQWAPGEEAAVGTLVQYLQDTYGVQLVEQTQPAADIVCQSGGTCTAKIGSQNYPCTCGGGSTCSAGQSCVCTCSWTGSNPNTLSCAYDCKKNARSVAVAANETEIK
jgi:hypothetical protein